MSIFERKQLPLSAAPLYYQALADLVDTHWGRLWQRLNAEESEAKAFLNLFRGESAAFLQTVISHIDQQARSKDSAAAKKKALKDGAVWIGFIRRSSGVAGRLVSPEEKERLKTLLHSGKDLNRSSAGAVLVELRYLSAILPDLQTKLSPPLHAEELTRGDRLVSALETALFGRVNATADQTQASVAKGKAWEVLEEKSKLLLDLARLEFSKEPEHADYSTRIAFEGLDEKFAPVAKTKEETPETTAPGAKQ